MPSLLVATHSYLPWSDSSLISICRAPGERGIEREIERETERERKRDRKRVAQTEGRNSNYIEVVGTRYVSIFNICKEKTKQNTEMVGTAKTKGKMKLGQVLQN